MLTLTIRICRIKVQCKLMWHLRRPTEDVKLVKYLNSATLYKFIQSITVFNGTCSQGNVERMGTSETHLPTWRNFSSKSKCREQFISEKWVKKRYFPFLFTARSAKFIHTLYIASSWQTLYTEDAKLYCWSKTSIKVQNNMLPRARVVMYLFSSFS